jgi:hypothetical protein
VKDSSSTTHCIVKIPFSCTSSMNSVKINLKKCLFSSCILVMHSKDNHSPPWSISATQGDHSGQLWIMSFYPMGIDWHWPISAIQDSHSSQHWNTKRKLDIEHFGLQVSVTFNVYLTISFNRHCQNACSDRHHTSFNILNAF